MAQKEIPQSELQSWHPAFSELVGHTSNLDKTLIAQHSLFGDAPMSQRLVQIVSISVIAHFYLILTLVQGYDSRQAAGVVISSTTTVFTRSYDGDEIDGHCTQLACNVSQGSQRAS